MQPLACTLAAIAFNLFSVFTVLSVVKPLHRPPLACSPSAAACSPFPHRGKGHRQAIFLPGG